MKRAVIRHALGACAILLALSSPAEPQQAGKIARLGFLAPGDAASESARIEAMRLALREIGYIEGQNVSFQYGYADGNPDRAPHAAAELVRLKVDLIVMIGGAPVIRAAKNATKTIPIVMTGPGLDPVRAGLVESLARPGGNVTGITTLSRELGGKRLELLKEFVPGLSRVGFVYDPANPGALDEAKKVLPPIARQLGLTIQFCELVGSGGLDKIFTALKKERPDALYVSAGGLLTPPNQKRAAGLALEHRLPSVFTNIVGIDAGGLMYYGADLADSYRRAAIYVDKILRGAKPAELPVEQPTKFELVINLKTAKQIGLTTPPNMLARADRVIK